MSRFTLNAARPLAHAVHLAVALGVFSALSLAPTHALAQNQTHTYQINAGSLGAALSLFATAANVTLSFNAEQTQGMTTPGLSGTYSTDEGLARLLAGSGLQAQRQANGAYVLVPVPVPVPKSDELQLGATTISGQALGSVSENTGSYTTSSMSTATKLAASMRETPQSVTVITRQRMDDQNMQSLEDISTYTPGLTMRKTGGERPEFYSRGSAIDNIMIDGLPVAIPANALDRIDEASGLTVAKDAVVRGSGASRPWMACVRLLEPWMAESGDAPDPRTAAAPPEADKSRCFGPGQKPAPPRLPPKPTHSGAFRLGRIRHHSLEKSHKKGRGADAPRPFRAGRFASVRTRDVRTCSASPAGRCGRFRRTPAATKRWDWPPTTPAPRWSGCCLPG